MATKERILALLRGTEAGRIRFTVATTDGLVTINRAVFETVATAIQTGKIKVRHKPYSHQVSAPSTTPARFLAARQESC